MIIAYRKVEAPRQLGPCLGVIHAPHHHCSVPFPSRARKPPRAHMAFARRSVTLESNQNCLLPASPRLYPTGPHEYGLDLLPNLQCATNEQSLESTQRSFPSKTLCNQQLPHHREFPVTLFLKRSWRPSVSCSEWSRLRSYSPHQIYGEQEKSGGVIRPTFLKHAGCVGDADYQCVNTNSAPFLRGA